MTFSERQLRIRRVAATCRGLVREPGLVRQPNDKTCVHACLAMVTGIPIEDVVWALGDHCGLSDDECFGFLGLCGIVARHVGPGRYPSSNVVSLGTVPSLNQEFKTHAIVMFARNGRWVIRDPNNGRTGKRIMTVKRWLGNSPQIFDFVELQQPSFWTVGDPLNRKET